MPLFTLPTIALYSNDSYSLFSSADSLTAPATSQVVTIAIAGQQPRMNATWTVDFASSPTAVVEIFGSNTQPTSAGPQNGTLIYTSTNTQHDNYVDNSTFTFYWAQLISQSGGGKLTVIVHVG
jgi:hypothetical protein